MNKKKIQKIYNDLKKSASRPTSIKKFPFSYQSNLLDYKSHLRDFSSDQFNLLNAMFNELAVSESIHALIEGDHVNLSEGKPALHHKYRESFPEPEFDFKKICKPFLKNIKSNQYKNIVTFGIGGSYEGPKLLQELMFDTSSKTNYAFVSGPDKDEFNSLVKPILGQNNLYIFASKSLSTAETLTCMKWLGSNRTKKNSIVITSNVGAAESLGFSHESILSFPESVGGRYSIWSPISLTSSIENNFMSFLRGGEKADQLLTGTSSAATKYQKFIKTLAFSDIWFNNFRNKRNRVVLSYNWRLRSLMSYIQQLEMESLGKPINKLSIFEQTGQTIFGGFGSTAQHSYFQMLNQGTSACSADIIYSPSIKSPLSAAQAQAQSVLLSTDQKKSIDSLEVTNGNIPVNLFILNELSLKGLGFLLASWEHRVFITASMLQINPFDQFGVTAGKKAANKFLK